MKNQIQRMHRETIDTSCHRIQNLFPGVKVAWCRNNRVISELRLGRSLPLTNVSVERRGILEKAHFRRGFFNRSMFDSYVRYALSRNYVTFFSTHPADIYLQTRHRMTNNILIYHRGTSFFRPAKKPRYYRIISNVMSNGSGFASRITRLIDEFTARPRRIQINDSCFEGLNMYND